jgi:beta-galactosidase
LIEKLEPLVKQGLAAAIYTQTSDVEGEINGLMTYDRKVVKFDAAKLAALHGRLMQSVPR